LRVNPGDELQHRISPVHMAINGILIGEHALCERLTDDSDRLVAVAVEIVEIPAGEDGNAQRGKESGRDHAKLRARILFAGGMNVTIGGELEAYSCACIAPGNNNAESGLFHARQRLDATNRFLVELNPLLRS